MLKRFRRRDPMSAIEFCERCVSVCNSACRSKALRARSLDINFLMTLAAVGAGIIGEWGEAAAAMFLFSVAQLLEGFAMGRARRAIAAP